MRYGTSVRAFRSSWREMMSSFGNTLRRWYSTVRGLMNSRAPISGFVCPSAAKRAICASWGVRLSRVSGARLRGGSPVAGRAPGGVAGRALARVLAGGEQLTAGALGEGVGPDAREQLVGGAQLLAGVDAAL